MNDALARVSIFGRSTRKAAQAAAVLATQMECSELEAAGRAQYVALQQETDRLWQRLITNDRDVVLAVLSHTFRSSSGNAAPLGVWDAEAHLALLAPDMADLPERHPATTAAGNLSLKKFTKGEMADLYKQLVAGLVLATAKEAFAVAPAVTNTRIVVVRDTPADAYGKIRPEAILAARVARAALNGVQWTKTDALTILNKINQLRTTHAHHRPKQEICATRSQDGAGDSTPNSRCNVRKLKSKASGRPKSLSEPGAVRSAWYLRGFLPRRTRRKGQLLVVIVAGRPLSLNDHAWPANARYRLGSEGRCRDRRSRRGSLLPESAASDWAH
jgi:hypothetical protein